MASPGSRAHLVVIAGPNGAGKSTAAAEVLKGTLAVSEFVNADVIARGLSAFNPQGAAVAAGRIMLQRLDELSGMRASFAFESTLASRSFATRILKLKQTGYIFHLAYFWLPTAQLAMARVASRVQAGGHHVPADVVQRRYHRSVANFLDLYRPLADTWRLYNAAELHGPTLIADSDGENIRVYDRQLWTTISPKGDDAQDGSN